LPHCGTTNRRLIMHFPLIGSEGVRFVVGNETVMNYGGGDGSPIVFDDSFEHHVYHEGNKDRFVVLAVLRHPDLM
jgi:Aspartyl/Asparaginyl beta-hydroxylase.